MKNISSKGPPQLQIVPENREGKGKELTALDLKKHFGKRTYLGKKWNQISLRWRTGKWVNNKTVQKLLGAMEWEDLEKLQEVYKRAVVNAPPPQATREKTRTFRSEADGNKPIPMDQFTGMLQAAKRRKRREPAVQDIPATFAPEDFADAFVAKCKKEIKESPDFIAFVKDRGGDDVFKWIDEDSLDRELSPFALMIAAKRKEGPASTVPSILSPHIEEIWKAMEGEALEKSRPSRATRSTIAKVKVGGMCSRWRQTTKVKYSRRSRPLRALDRKLNALGEILLDPLVDIPKTQRDTMIDDILDDLPSLQSPRFKKFAQIESFRQDLIGQLEALRNSEIEKPVRTVDDKKIRLEKMLAVWDSRTARTKLRRFKAQKKSRPLNEELNTLELLLSKGVHTTQEDLSNQIDKVLGGWPSDQQKKPLRLKPSTALFMESVKNEMDALKGVLETPSGSEITCALYLCRSKAHLNKLFRVIKKRYPRIKFNFEIRKQIEKVESQLTAHHQTAAEYHKGLATALESFATTLRENSKEEDETCTYLDSLSENIQLLAALPAGGLAVGQNKIVADSNPLFEGMKDAVQHFNGKTTVAHSPVGSGTVSSTVPINGDEIFQTIGNLIRNANKSVVFQNYLYYERSESAKYLFEALHDLQQKQIQRKQEAEEQGKLFTPVSITFMLDAGIGKAAQTQKGHGGIWQALEDGGIVSPKNEISLYGIGCPFKIDPSLVRIETLGIEHHRRGTIHTKTVVVDDKYAVVTSANVKGTQHATSMRMLPQLDAATMISGEEVAGALIEDFNTVSSSPRCALKGGNAHEDQYTNNTEFEIEATYLPIARTAGTALASSPDPIKIPESIEDLEKGNESEVLVISKPRVNKMIASETDLHTPQQVAYRHAFQNAQTKILITQPNLNVQWILDDLVDALLRGVEVKICIPKGCNDDTESMERYFRLPPSRAPHQDSSLKPLDATNLGAYKYLQNMAHDFKCSDKLELRWFVNERGDMPFDNKLEGIQHIKYVEADEVGIFASTNLDYQSMEFSGELSVASGDTEVVRQWRERIWDPIWNKSMEENDANFFLDKPDDYYLRKSKSDTAPPPSIPQKTIQGYTDDLREHCTKLLTMEGTRLAVLPRGKNWKNLDAAILKLMPQLAVPADDQSRKDLTQQLDKCLRILTTLDQSNSIRYKNERIRHYLYLMRFNMAGLQKALKISAT